MKLSKYELKKYNNFARKKFDISVYILIDLDIAGIFHLLYVFVFVFTQSLYHVSGSKTKIISLNFATNHFTNRQDVIKTKDKFHTRSINIYETFCTMWK